MASYKKNLKLVREHLQSNETILTSVEGVYVKNEWTRNGIFVATENRVIFFAKKFSGFDLESFPFKNISSYEYGKELLGHKIKFFASGNEVKMKWIQSDNINEFNDFVNSNIGQQNNTQEFMQTESIASQLEKLASLLEKKLISDEEFKNTKAELLNKKSSDENIKRPISAKESINNNSDIGKTKNKRKLSFIHIIGIGLILLIIYSIISSDNQIIKYKGNEYRYTITNLNLRKGPSSEHKVLRVLKPNEKLFIYDSIVNNYILVLNSDSTKKGWVSDNYLQTTLLSEKQLKELAKSQKKNSEIINHNKKVVGDEKWYSGGNLHQKYIRDWKKATYANKLATCADFISATEGKMPMGTLRIKASSLVTCITTATEGLDVTNNYKISEIAASCMVLMKK